MGSINSLCQIFDLSLRAECLFFEGAMRASRLMDRRTKQEQRQSSLWLCLARRRKMKSNYDSMRQRGTKSRQIESPLFKTNFRWELIGPTLKHYSVGINIPHLNSNYYHLNLSTPLNQLQQSSHRPHQFHPPCRHLSVRRLAEPVNGHSSVSQVKFTSCVSIRT